MPKADLPTTIEGWLTAVGAAVVGFIAGFVFISLITKGRIG